LYINCTSLEQFIVWTLIYFMKKLKKKSKSVILILP
jgi:hypothetical protein